jgi:hypothetical protein
MVKVSPYTRVLELPVAVATKHEAVPPPVPLEFVVIE